LSSLTKKKRPIREKELFLVLNAAEGRLQFVLGRPGPDDPDTPELLAAEDWSAVSRGVELLAPALADALKNLQLSPTSIGKIAAVTGPGGFTGLRLVTVTANALALALDARSAAIEYLPLLAAGVKEYFGVLLSESTAVWVLTYARRGLVYAQGFHVRGAALEKISSLLVLGLEESLNFLTEQSAKYGTGLLLGSGLAKNPARFGQNRGENFRLLPPAFNHPSPDLLLKTALNLVYAENNLSPFYARPSDAEENLPHIAAALGPDQSLTRRLTQGMGNGISTL
jgi:tRNA threonylcarbamoyl adenosine modification protein YeaZ